MKIKYIRVSTTHQNTERQEQNAGEFDKVFIDRESGKNTARPQLQAMLDFVREGDIVYFESFSRLSRSLTDLLAILDRLAGKGVVWVSEKEQISTQGASGRLIVSVLGAIAQYEREINAERREYGFRRAVAERRVGRPEAVLTPAFYQAYKEWRAGEKTAREAMRACGMSKSVWYRKVKEIEVGGGNSRE